MSGFELVGYAMCVLTVLVGLLALAEFAGWRLGMIWLSERESSRSEGPGESC